MTTYTVGDRIVTCPRYPVAGRRRNVAYRDRVYYWLPTRTGAKVGCLIEHVGRQTLPAKARGPFGTPTAATMDAIRALEHKTCGGTGCYTDHAQCGL